MSAVDQSGWVRAGRVRRLLVRVLLVVGGALVVTGIGWLVSSASASADVLPVTPSAVVSSVTDAITAPTLPTPTLPTPALPSAPADLGQVAQQVHLAVAGASAPVTAPAADLVSLVDTVSGPVDHPLAVTTPVAVPTAIVPAVRSVTVVAHRHLVASDTRPRAGGSTPASVPARHLPVLPPLQPAGSSDANAHGSGGPAGGTGGTQSPFVTLFGAAPHAVGLPITPRLPVAPGHQPGTSPD